MSVSMTCGGGASRAAQGTFWAMPAVKCAGGGGPTSFMETAPWPAASAAARTAPRRCLGAVAGRGAVTDAAPRPLKAARRLPWAAACMGPKRPIWGACTAWGTTHRPCFLVHWSQGHSKQSEMCAGGGRCRDLAPRRAPAAPLLHTGAFPPPAHAARPQPRLPKSVGRDESLQGMLVCHLGTVMCVSKQF